MASSRGPWLAPLGATLGVALACTSSDVYQCQSDGDCMVSGIVGTCQPDLYCSFPSDDCPSGQEYGQFTPPELAGTCVPAGGTDSTGRPQVDSGDTAVDSGSDDTTTRGETTGVEPPTGEPPADPSLVLWLTMDELQGDEIVDQSGYGNHAYCLQVCPLPTRGVTGTGLDFLESGTPVFVPMTEELYTPEQFTVAVWVLPHVLSGSAMTIAEIPLVAETNPNWSSWEFRLEGANGGVQDLYFATATVAEQSVVQLPEHPLSEGIWHHLVGVWEGQTLMLYIDGEPWGAAPGIPPDFDGQDLYIGGGLSDGMLNDWFVGAVDDFRLYNRALSVEEVQALYESPGSP